MGFATTVAGRAETSARWTAIALGFSLPISVAVDNVLVGLILIAWLASLGAGRKWARLWGNPSALATLGFLALLLLGMAWGPGGRQEDLHYFGKYADLIVVTLLGTLALSDRDRELGLIAFGAAMGLTLIASYGIWLELIPVRMLGEARGPDNPVVFKLHITHGVMMALAAFLAAVAALHVPTVRVRAVLSGASALAAFNVLFMVQGRTGYLVLAVLAAYLFISRWHWRGVAAAAVGGAVAIGAAQFMGAPLLDRVAKVVTELQEWRAGGAQATSTGLRLNYYHTSLAIMRDHPLLGVGTGGFAIAYKEKVAGTGQVESNNPHNQYLLTGVQLGVIGLVALLALFGVMWRHAGRLPPPFRLAARGLVLAIAVGSLLNSFLIDHTEGLLFAWMAGLLLGAGPRQAASPHQA